MRREYLSWEKKIYLKLKKEKLKTKKFSKITRKRKSTSKNLLENQEPHYNQQTEPKQCKSEVEEICVYPNLESGYHSIGALYLKMLVSMIRKNPKQQYLKVATFSDASFSKMCIYVYDYAA